jgi:hypothetical protein
MAARAGSAAARRTRLARDEFKPKRQTRLHLAPLLSAEARLRAKADAGSRRAKLALRGRPAKRSEVGRVRGPENAPLFCAKAGGLKEIEILHLLNTDVVADIGYLAIRPRFARF